MKRPDERALKIIEKLAGTERPISLGKMAVLAVGLGMTYGELSEQIGLCRERMKKHRQCLCDGGKEMKSDVINKKVMRRKTAASGRRGRDLAWLVTYGLCLGGCGALLAVVASGRENGGFGGEILPLILCAVLIVWHAEHRVNRERFERVVYRLSALMRARLGSNFVMPERVPQRQKPEINCPGRLAQDPVRARPVSLGEISNVTGIPVEQLADIYYRRCRVINFDTIERLCECLGCPAGELFEEEPDETRC